MTNLVIEEVNLELIKPWVILCHQLWPEHQLDSLKAECHTILKKPKETAFLLSIDKKYVGFINASIRSDYVPGASSSPAGYIEGIYIKPRFRHRGLAKTLVEHAIHWFASQGCKEVASDAEIENNVSQSWHEAMGFSKINALMHYIAKQLKSLNDRSLH